VLVSTLAFIPRVVPSKGAQKRISGGAKRRYVARRGIPGTGTVFLSFQVFLVFVLPILAF